ncbi:MAG TPA: FAD-dependent oxidoreductase, partial [Pirellulaceae bacterium]|nr:FAD-dependent oxidoreductase [Pirellulaceae bacterium]
MSSQQDSAEQVIVIGGGIIGVMCAWYLTETGRSVTIVERGQLGQGCSHGNCGYVSPSHILPLTTPGAIGMALRSMLSNKSPFYIKPRWSPAMWSWLWRFARRCNRVDMLRAADTLHAMLQSSKTLYRDLVNQQKLDCEWEENGILFVFQSRDKFEHYAETDKLLTDRYGVAAKPIDGAHLEQMEPALVPGLGGAWLYECDAHLRPDSLLREMRRLLVQRGVRIVEEAEVIGFEARGRRADAVRTNHANLQAHQFVVATGAWTPFLNRHLGCRIPIQPGKGYSLTMPRPKLCPHHSMIFEEHRVAITPLRSKFRIGSTMEFAGYDTTINPRRLEILKDAARLYLREPNLESVEETWYGWRPMTTDGLPYIDRTPAFDNVWVAAGHNMLGLSLATVTGKLIAEF